MNRALLAISLSAALWGMHAHADLPSRPISPKRQLVVCMNRQMSASRTISYNEATKLCKAQLQAQNATLVTNATVSSTKRITGVSQ